MSKNSKKRKRNRQKRKEYESNNQWMDKNISCLNMLVDGKQIELIEKCCIAISSLAQRI